MPPLDNATETCPEGNRLAQQDQIPALLVSGKRALNGGTGGVGICTKEYMSVLEVAGFRLGPLCFDSDMSMLTRIRRRIRPRSYRDLIPSGFSSQVLAEAERSNAAFIFLNMVDTAVIAEDLRCRLSQSTKIVLLSHGLESVDYLHSLGLSDEIRKLARLKSKSQTELARQLCIESRQRSFIDHVFCLAPFEAEIERWLGARAATWLPRTVNSQPLPWRPTGDRFGFVGSLDHPPNISGLIKLLDALVPDIDSREKARIVGGPEEVGKALADRYKFVDYLGMLDDHSLAKEAATWTCFINPIFCYPRGCSTKLAIGLGWEIPVVTTTPGARGYQTSLEDLPIADSPDEFAAKVLTILRSSDNGPLREKVRQIVRLSPTSSEVANTVRSALGLQQSW